MSANLEKSVEIDAKDAFPPSRHVYGRSASLCINYVISRSRQATVELQIAPAKSPGPGYQWDRKVQLQLSHTELAGFAAAICFPGPRLEFSRQGKSVDIVWQEPNLLVSLRRQAEIYRVPITPGDQHFVRLFLLNRLSQAQPSSDELLLFSLKRLAQDLTA